MIINTIQNAGETMLDVAKWKPTKPIFTVEFFESGNFDCYSVIRYNPSDKLNAKLGFCAVATPTIKWTRMQGSCSMMEVWWMSYQNPNEYAEIQNALEQWYKHSRNCGGMGSPHVYLATMMGPSGKAAIKGGLDKLGWTNEEFSTGAYSSTPLSLMRLDLSKKKITETGQVVGNGNAAAFCRLWAPDDMPTEVFDHIAEKVKASEEKSKQTNHWGHAKFAGHWAKFNH